MTLKTIQWIDNAVLIIDQTALPSDLVYERIETAEAMWDAIKTLKVRGAPAIGIAAAFGLYLGVRPAPDTLDREAFLGLVRERARYLAFSPSDRRQPRLGSEPAISGRGVACRRKGAGRADKGTAPRRVGCRSRRGSPLVPVDRRARLCAAQRQEDDIDALQCGRAGDLRIRHRARAGLCGARTGEGDPCLCRRNAAAPAGSAHHRL